MSSNKARNFLKYVYPIGMFTMSTFDMTLTFCTWCLINNSVLIVTYAARIEADASNCFHHWGTIFCEIQRLPCYECNLRTFTNPVASADFQSYISLRTTSFPMTKVNLFLSPHFIQKRLNDFYNSTLKRNDNHN